MAMTRTPEDEAILSFTMAVGLASLNHTDVTQCMQMYVELLAYEAVVHHGRRAKSALEVRNKLLTKLRGAAENLRMLAGNLETLSEELKVNEQRTVGDN